MKNFLLKVKVFLIKLFAAVEKYLPIGIEVVNRFKKFIDSHEADLLTALIPGTLDDAVKVWLRLNLQKIIDSFGGVQTILNLPKPAQNQIYLGIAAKINQELSNDIGKESITLPQAIVATQAKYNEKDFA